MANNLENTPQTLGTAESTQFAFKQKAKQWSSENFDNELSQQKIDELTWRVKARKYYGRGFMLLLFVQNAFLFYLINKAYVSGNLEELSLILGTFVAGTLIETSYIVRIIVTELFKDINYKDYDDKR